MPRVDLVVETKLSRSARVRQLEAMFDVPPQEKARLTWTGEVPLETRSVRVREKHAAAASVRESGGSLVVGAVRH